MASVDTVVLVVDVVYDFVFVLDTVVVSVIVTISVKVVDNVSFSGYAVVVAVVWRVSVLVSITGVGVITEVGVVFPNTVVIFAVVELELFVGTTFTSELGRPTYVLHEVHVLVK